MRSLVWPEQEPRAGTVAVLRGVRRKEARAFPRDNAIQLER